MPAMAQCQHGHANITDEKKGKTMGLLNMHIKKFALKMEILAQLSKTNKVICLHKDESKNTSWKLM